MRPLIRIDKRIPDGSIWQARRVYLLDPLDGWARTYGPAGTRWSNPLGGWTTEFEGVSVFRSDQPFTISCNGPIGDKRFYIDIAHRVRITPALIEFVDLYLDVLIDASGRVSEKDEEQLAFLPPGMRDFARAARDQVRARIVAADPLFDADSAFYEVPEDSRRLPPASTALEISG